MYTVNQIGKTFNLSRSTLLYYDKIGLLSPSQRSSANYRLYSQTDFTRLEKIALYRDAGLSLEKIAEILAGNTTRSSEILEQRLENLNQEMSVLRQQQQLVVTMLGVDSSFRKTRIMNKDQWVNILKASGMGEEAMCRWHMEFERDLPEAHTDFLESLGIAPNEIQKIKAWSRL